MCATGLPRTVADPKEMRRSAIPMAAGGIDARQRLFITEKKRFVAGVKLRRAKLRNQLGRHATRFHKAQRLANPVGQHTVAFARGGSIDEIERPAMHIVQVGIAACRKRPQQIQRCCRLPITLEQTLRIRRATLRVEFKAVDIVAAIGRKSYAALSLSFFGTRLGELTRDPAHLYHWHSGRKGQDHSHLQDYPKRVADIVGMELSEAFRAVPALEQESSAGRDLRQSGHQVPRLARKYQRWIRFQARFHCSQSCSVRILRHLLDWLLAPT